MVFLFLATMTAIIHGLFVVFVIAGGMLGYVWAPVIRLHLPVALYGVAIMVFDWPCPLTQWEIALRARAGQSVEWSEFLQHYLFSPAGMTGQEWYVLVALIGAIAGFNYRPYRKLWRKTG